MDDSTKTYLFLVEIIPTLFYQWVRQKISGITGGGLGRQMGIILAITRS